MKTYIAINGMYEDVHISACTNDLDIAIKEWIKEKDENEYHSCCYGELCEIQIWEDNELLFTYYINDDIDMKENNKTIIYKNIKDDMLRQLREEEKL